ncbi:MAG: hypothetical protein FWF28_05365 [Micrococcales bacterium]|nr:hypothetical protein [Micrococcales bacterium]
MKPRLLPVYLEDETPEPDFYTQLAVLKELTSELVDWLDPAPIGAPVPPGVAAVAVPDMNGRAYRKLAEFRRIEVPILVITTEFGTVSMWDWEIRDFLRRRGVATIAPTSLTETLDVCRALALKDELARSTMVAYLDDLGAGMQPWIFKRFYWWEDECVNDMQDAFGLTIQRRSFRELVARAAAVPEERVAAAADRIWPQTPHTGLTSRAQAEALQLYLALSDEADETPGVIAMGINCLNESATSVTTPCLAWNLLYQERGILWGCESDLTSMITETLVHKSFGAPVMMTNLYPFLMGDAAIRHERIPYFPAVDSEPENHILVAHCGFFGLVPQPMASQWTLRNKVLAIVDENANMIDARFPEGPTTIVKIASDMRTLAVCPAELTKYEQFKESDCLNGAVLKVADGYRYVEMLPSHHAVLATGDLRRRLEVACAALGMNVLAI